MGVVNEHFVKDERVLVCDDEDVKAKVMVKKFGGYAGVPDEGGGGA